MSWTIENETKPKRVKVFGGFIRMRRKVLKLKQREVAKALGYHDPVSVSGLERGKTLCPEHRLASLARLIDVNLFDLKRIYDLDFEMRARQAHREEMR